MPIVTPPKPLPPEVAQWRVIFVGASVGYGWRLPLVYSNFSLLTSYGYDKSAEIDEAIASRPDAIVIKECAAYFPSDGVDRDLMELWVDRITQAGIACILTTVAPVTRHHARSHPGRAERIWAFNDWLRALAHDRDIALLDLEGALRSSERDPYLHDALHSGDGLHLKRRTYRQRLDHLIPITLLAAHQSQHRDR